MHLKVTSKCNRDIHTGECPVKKENEIISSKMQHFLCRCFTSYGRFEVLLNQHLEKLRRRFFNRMYQIWPPKSFFSHAELHIILNRRNLEICECSSFLNYWRGCLLNPSWKFKKLSNDYYINQCNIGNINQKRNFQCSIKHIFGQ